MRWIKNFGIRCDVLTIYSLVNGLRYIKKAYSLPNCINYKYLDGEEYRDDKYLEEIKQIVKRDPKKWTKKIVSKLSAITDEFESFCKQKIKINTRIGLYRKYQEFFKRYSYFLGICDIPIFVEDAVFEAIADELKQKKVKDFETNFKILTTYLRDSHINEEEKDLLEIAIKAARRKNIFRNFSKIEKDPLYREIVNQYKKYRWMGFRITIGQEHTLYYYISRLRNNIKTADRTLNKFLFKQKQAKIAFVKAVRGFQLDKELIECGQKLIWIRDKRYVGLTRGAFNKRDLFEAIGQKTGINIGDVYYLTPFEIRDVLVDEKPIDLTLIRQRQVGFALILLDGKIGKVITGKKLKTLKQEKIIKVDKIVGVSANSGKITGRVRLVMNDSDFLKFKEKEILVTDMTSPDYSTLMKKSAAIVTDLGGITCHAAIVSRELGIPCVIGTKIATKVLKNGDIVEVDANKGIVKIIK